MEENLYLTPWGCLSRSELYALAQQANERGDFEERDALENCFDTCAAAGRAQPVTQEGGTK